MLLLLISLEHIVINIIIIITTIIILLLLLIIIIISSSSSISHTICTLSHSCTSYPGLSLGTPSPPTKSLGFEGFDSSRLLILRGGNSHVR